ncbi:retroviral-like aspartic protease family protein [Lichenicoccus roseus]|nr:retroviral-like aspartic protease family protein [Lichenicoccus roseus]
MGRSTTASPSIRHGWITERTMLVRLLAIMLPTLLPGLLAACAESASGPPACRIDRVADLPIVPGTRLPAVRATLEGEPVLFYIDTGAAMTILTRSTADHFGFRGASDRRIGLGGIGGVVEAPVVAVRRLDLGHGVARDIQMPVASDFGPPVQGLRVAGLFGADFLSNYDVDLDVPGHHFALYDLRQCRGELRPLDAAFDIPIRLESTRIELQAMLNGHPIDAVLDSGAVGTLVTEDDAARAGVTRQMLRSDPAVFAIGVDEERLRSHRHRFDTLEIGDETMRNYRFTVSDTDFTLIGEDFLRSNHVWISYPRRRLFVQPKIR